MQSRRSMPSGSMLSRSGRARRRYRIAAALALFGLIADQGSKWLLIHGLGLTEGDRIRILPIFDLVLWWNRGISFSMLHTGSSWGPYLFSVASLVIIGFLVLWLSRTTSVASAAAIGAVIGGALGNVVDRLRFGAVADFFYAHVGEYGWPAFNVADSLIVVGVGVLILDGLLGSNPAGGIVQRDGK